MHRVGFVHRDVKPSNFVRRNDKTTQFCVIDFGLTKLYRERTGQLRPEKPHADFRGTTVYASPFVHSGHDQCPRDDLLSALHVFFDMIIGKLPWGDAARSKDKITAAATKKNMYVHPDEFIGWLCEEVSAKSPTALEVNFPSQTRIIALSIILKLANLKYADVPDYDWLDKQFEEMVPEAQRQDIGDINFSFEGFNWHETSSRSATFMATAMSRYSVSGVGNDFVSPIPFSGEKARNVSLSGRQNWDKTILFADDSHRLSSSNLPTIATGWNDGNGIDGAVANASETLTPLLSAGVHRSTSDRDLSNIHLYNEKLRSYTATLEKLLHDSLLNSGNNHLGSSQVLSGDARKEIFRIALRWANVMKLVYQLPASVVPQNVIEVALRIARHHRHFFGAHIEDDMPDRWEEFCQWQEMIGKSYEIYKRILTSASESRKRSASELAVDVLPENEKRLRTSPNNAI
jgi:serine/threonine protein kinase